jgi:membrane associated rhomboid family serine protease
MSITIFIIILTALVSVTAFNNHAIFDRLKFNPSFIRSEKSYYRFLTYGLLHADWAHLLINMFVFFSFGRIVETIFTQHFGAIGNVFFILLYLLGLIASVIPAFFKHKENFYYNAVGASGAVAAVLFASILLFPQNRIIFIFFPVPIPAFIFGILYLVYSAYMAKRGTDNIGHDAHFWGAVFGVLFTIVLDPAFVSHFIRNVF